MRPTQESNQGTRFIDRYRLFIQQRGYSYATEKTYIAWAVRFLKHFKFQQESEIRLEHLEQFLTFLAVERHHSPNSQKTVLSALVFLFRDFMGLSTKGLQFNRASPGIRAPVVLNASESKQLFIQLSGSYRLLAKLMYGCGLRLAEAAKLRQGHLDLETMSLLISQGKGNKDRYVPIPKSLTGALHTQLAKVEQLHQDDINDGFGYVPTSANLTLGNSHPSRELHYQFLFPNLKRSFDSKANTFWRLFIPEQKIRRQIKEAANKAGIPKKVTCHTLRHSYATELLKQGVDIRSVQSLLGHESVKTTEIYTHVVLSGMDKIKSPLDCLEF